MIKYIAERFFGMRDDQIMLSIGLQQGHIILLEDDTYFGMPLIMLKGFLVMQPVGIVPQLLQPNKIGH
jgi:hypothetical protein